MKPRHPYGVAALVGAAVLAGYVFSLAPSVTFWDAGEFVASMKILGIPHPPGTPLFVLLGHVWGHLLPFGEFAWRTNLLSAMFSAGAAAFWFLVIQDVLRRALADRPDGAVWSRWGGAAATIMAAFSFTNWQNSNETEVYAVASFIIAAITWLALQWREDRASGQAPKRLMLIAYLLGISIANHLLALLAGPAVILFMVVELRLHPSESPERRRREWAHTAVMAGLWGLLLGVGLGSGTLALLGGTAMAAALIFAAFSRTLAFGVTTLLVALVGVTPYLYLYIRSAQNPMINEAAPATWDALLAVIRRAQYPIRTPLDDPTIPHGPDNPGRNLQIVGLQLLNYVQYFDWQWAKSFGAKLGGLPLRIVVTLLFLSLGLKGLATHRKADRSGWWLLFGLWLVTGLGLVAYMNFRPGNSLGYELYPNADDHEVRERDYFFVISFVGWSLWAGVGLTASLARLKDRLPAAGRMAPLGLAAALLPVVLNFKEADRRHGPDARLPGDFAYDLLNSVPPYGILFTYGDNDTFPLWWAQEVAGIRPDVTVVCTALARTDWYIKQLRENPVRPFDEAKAPAYWHGLSPVEPTWPLHTMTDADIAAAVPQLVASDVEIKFGRYPYLIKANSPLYPEDFLKLRVLQQNFGRRPIVWALTSSGQYYGLDSLVVQRGIGLVLDSVPPNPADPNFDFRKMFGAALDRSATERLLFETYRYADLLEDGPHQLETTANGIAQTIAVPFTQLAFAAEARGEYDKMVKYLERSSRLSTNPAFKTALEEARSHLPAKTP